MINHPFWGSPSVGKPHIRNIKRLKNQQFFSNTICTSVGGTNQTWLNYTTFSEYRMPHSMPCLILLPMRGLIFCQDPQCLTHRKTWLRYRLIIVNGWYKFLPRRAIRQTWQKSNRQFRCRKVSKSLGRIMGVSPFTAPNGGCSAGRRERPLSRTLQT